MFNLITATPSARWSDLLIVFLHCIFFFIANLKVPLSLSRSLSPSISISLPATPHNEQFWCFLSLRNALVTCGFLIWLLYFGAPNPPLFDYYLLSKHCCHQAGDSGMEHWCPTSSFCSTHLRLCKLYSVCFAFANFIFYPAFWKW